MKFTCEQERLSRMLGVVNHAVAKGTGALPIATNIRLSSDADRIKLDATNLNIGITGWVEGSIKGEGEVAIPAKLFTELINALSPGKIEITVDDATHEVQVDGQRGQVHIRGFDPAEFPLMPSLENMQPTLLKAALLKEVIREVSIAVDESGSREVFGNILMQIEKSQITFAAADGWGKLAFRTLPLPAESALNCSILVPGRSFMELGGILPTDGMAEIRLTPNNSQVIISTQWMILSSILASGIYPNYKATLPREKRTRVTVRTSEFREIVQLTSLFARGDFDAGHITIQGSLGMEPGTLTITSEAADVGRNHNTISVTVEGDNQEDVIFNVATLSKVLGVISAPEIIFEIGMTRVPVGVIKPAGAYTVMYSISSMGTAS